MYPSCIHKPAPCHLQGLHLRVKSICFCLLFLPSILCPAHLQNKKEHIVYSLNILNMNILMSMLFKMAALAC